VIPYGRQSISQADIDAVIEVLRSDFLTQGPAVPRFEACVADYCAAAHAVAVHSATAALHLACMALGVGPGDWVWTSPITFVASANCALYCGAQIDFVDIDPRTFNLCPRALEDKLAAAARAGQLPKVLIAVHLCGQPCEMQPIHALAAQYGVRVIEDASHAIGARYQDEPVGAGRYSDITVFSFHPVKIITTGEGGMALTQSAELAQRMRLLRTHGITREAASMTQPPDGPWYYQQIALGFNYRMTDIQAALGVSQMARLGEFLAARQRIAQRYDEALTGLPLATPRVHPDAQSAFHLYVIRLENAAQRAGLFAALQTRGVAANVHYIPVHTQPFYARMGFAADDFPEAMRYYRAAISLPIFPGLSEDDQNVVIDCIRESLA
jgi:UDP-4-amino-4,6-dideoxy-N-acetyl-beta-L-altrosamine transaminase